MAVTSRRVLKIVAGLAGLILAAAPLCFAADGGFDADPSLVALPGSPLQAPLMGPPARPLFTGHDVDLEKVQGDEDDLVDLCVQAAMTRGGTPGAAVAVMVDGSLVYEQGYGVKRRNGSEPVNPRTVFRIGSITKMMTAAAVMQQVDLGKVALDDPVTRWVPDFQVRAPWQANHITVQHLLTHASGFPDLLFNIDGRTDEDALGDWASVLGPVELHAAPGSFWNYSNPNFMLAGLVAESRIAVCLKTRVTSDSYDP